MWVESVSALSWLDSSKQRLSSQYRGAYERRLPRHDACRTFISLPWISGSFLIAGDRHRNGMTKPSPASGVLRSAARAGPLERVSFFARIRVPSVIVTSISCLSAQCVGRWVVTPTDSPAKIWPARPTSWPFGHRIAMSISFAFGAAPNDDLACLCQDPTPDRIPIRTLERTGARRQPPS
jgi:hypothetical protein